MGTFLETIDKSLRQRLEHEMSVREYDRGSFVISQHDVADDVFFVLEGRARAAVYSSEGKLVSYRDIESGSIFGELSALDETPRSAAVIAQDNLVAGRLSGKEFRHWVETDPELMWAVLKYLTGQCRRMTDRIFEFSTMLVKDRLVNELVRLSRAVSEGANTAIVTPAPTHFDLAASISTHREAVSREMSLLTKNGLIRKENGLLYVPDIEALCALTEEI